ncbi:hypothetical protein RHOSPDRAFT_31606 [Rhodotorula sp. JG-1b]|nr:hypothetical protein RHOSPDRAFT_31606 [Rhodotorula sp. JG-1b]
MMFTSLVTAAAAFAAVQAAPISLAVVESSLSVPNSTYTDVSVINYRMTGKTGACGWTTEAADLSVGLPSELYADLGAVSSYCGLYAVVTDPRTNLSATALVADGSNKNDTLSVSDATWNALNGTDSQLKTVTWRFANETETAAAKAARSDSSSSESSPSSSSAAPSSSSSAAAQASSSAAPASSSSSAAAKASSSSSSAEKQSSTSTWEASSSSAKAQTTTTSQYVAPTTTTTSQWVAPTTTQAAATKAVSNASSGSYSGQATFYSQGGVAGSCGSVASDSDYVVAVNTAQVDGGSHCGSSVHITNTQNGKSITARVADTCPGCGYGSLDLSMGAFGALGSYDQGVLPISWSFA